MNWRVALLAGCTKPIIGRWGGETPLRIVYRSVTVHKLQGYR